MNWPASRILIIHLVLGATQAVAQNAYITNQGDNTVSVINIATNSVTATIPVGQTPFGVAVTPNGGKVYITNSDGGSVSVIDASSNTVVATIPIGPGPAGVAVAPDGTKVYVANAGEPYSSPGKVSVISTASDTVTATISTGGNFSSFNGLAVTPDGNRIYATEYSAGAVAVIDTASNAITATIPIGRVGSDYTSYGVAITPDGSKVYEADSGGVRVIDAGTNTAGPGIPGAGGTALAVTPDGTRVYTSGGGSISTATDKYLPQSPVAGEILGVSIGVSITPDGTRVYIPSYFPPGSSDSLNVVYVVSTATNALLGTINVGSQPAAFGSFIGRALPPAPTPPEISQITPNTIPVNSSPTTLRILGNGLAGTTFTTCSAPPETVTWNGTTLTISSASATEIDVSVPAILLTTVGNYTVTVSVNQVNGNSCQTLTATGTVQVTSLPGGVLGVSSSSLSLAALSGILPTPQSVQVTSTSGTLSYGVSVQYPSAAPANWVALSATAGSTSPGNPGNLMISALSAAASFSSGTYTATVNITAGSQVKTVAVALTITALLNAPSVLVFGAVVGPLAPSTAQDPQTLQVDVAGDPLGFTYTITPAIGQGSVPTCSSLNQATLESSGWLTINGSAVPSGIGTTGQQLLLSVKPVGLGPGTYLDDIVLSAQGSTTTIKVYLVVENLQNVAFNFSYSIGGPAPTQQTAGIFTSGCGVRVANMALGYTSDQSWLTAVLNASGGGFSVNLTATPAGLSAGSYRGVAAVTDGSGDVFLLVCALTVVAPSKTSTATQLSASPNPAIVNQLVTLTATVSPATTGGVVFYDGATSLGSVNLSAGVATMSMAFATVGSHSLTATFSGNATYASSATTPFSLQVNSLPPPPATYITAAPSSQSLGSPVTLTATVCWCVYSGPALPPVPTGTVTFLDGTTQIGSSQLVVGSGSSVATLSISTLAVGTHLLQAAYGGDTSNGPSKSSTVSETITSANTPSILTGGIVNAASFAVANAVGAPVSPGSLVAIFTSALAAQAAIFSTATLPNMLGGASVTFNNIQAPMVQVVPGGAYPFISAQVPFEVLAAGQTSATVPVVITVNNVPSAPVMCQIVASQPGIFTLTANGQGYPVLVNLADYSIAAPVGTASFSHPIPRGQTAFFYVTGLGELTPSVVDGTGTCTASDGLCHATPTPTVSVGGAPATVGFAGQAPGFPGVMQINITIPLTASTGDTVTLTVTSADGTVTSNAATIAVQ